MRATDFEYRHQTLLHLLVVGLAFLTYVIQPDDIVWALVKHHTTYRSVLERLVFGTGALMIVGAALIQTRASAYGTRTASRGAVPASDGPYRYVQHRVYFGRILFALGLGLLAPALGSFILIAGEVLLITRLLGRDQSVVPHSLTAFRPALSTVEADWGMALRKQAAKWGLAMTMIVFTLTLRDRIAEILAAASFLVWVLLNIPDFVRSSRSSGHA
jgi:protein-S-isoprenylcysteine O-methyltransferase Ste14